MLGSPYLLKRLVRRPIAALLLAGAVAVGTGVPAALMSATQTYVALVAPYPNATRLVRLIRQTPSSTRFFSISEFAQLTNHLPAIELAAFSHVRLGVETARKTTDTRVLLGSTTLLQVLGLSASAGRVPSDDGNTKQALVSERIWRGLGHEHFEQGHVVVIDGEAHEIVGLLPHGLRRPFDAEVWLPLPIPDGGPGNGRFLTVLAVLPNPSSALALSLAVAKEGERWVAVDLRKDLMGRTAAVIPLLTIIAALAWIGITLSVSFAAVIRLWWHQRAIGILSSLGASAVAVVLWGLDELVVSMMLGVAAAVWVSRSANGLVLVFLGESASIVPTATPLLWLIGVAGLCVVTGGCIVTVVTVKRARVRPISPVGASRPRPSFLFLARAAIVAVSTTAVVVAVYGTGTALAMSRLELGFDAEGVIYQRLRLPAGMEGSTDSITSLVEEVFVNAGYAEAATASSVPLLDPVGRTLVESGDGAVAARAILKLVSPSFFSVMRIPFVTGQTLEAGELTAVVSEKTASMFWPDPDNADRVLRLGPARLRITGIVRDVVDDPLSSGVEPIVYLSFAFGLPKSIAVLARGSRSPSLEGLNAIALPNSIAAGDNGWLQGVVVDWMRPHQLMLRLVSAVGLCAAALVALVTYLIALLLAELEQRELTIKAALGASPMSLMRDIASRQAKSFLAGMVGAAGLSASATFFALGPLDERWSAALLVAGTLMLVSTAVGLIGVFPSIRKQPSLSRALFDATH